MIGDRIFGHPAMPAVRAEGEAVDTYLKIQNARFTDWMSADPDGELAELTKLPHPIYVDQDGKIARQDVWMGTMVRVVGFVGDLHRAGIDVWWRDARKDYAKVVGMYMVTAGSDGSMGVHQTAVDSISVVTSEDQP